jgi:Amt family ammonium transporter
VLAQKAWSGGADGLLAGNPKQLAIQALAVVAAMAYSALGTFALLKLIAVFAPLRTAPRDEGLGLDVSQHGEEAYTQGEGAILVLPMEGTAEPEPQAVPRLAPEGGAL